MAPSPSLRVASSSFALHSFPARAFASDSLPDALLPQRDIPLPTAVIPSQPAPPAVGIGRRAPYHCAWSVEPCSYDGFAKLVSVSRALPNDWNLRSLYPGKGFSADTEQEAITMLFFVTNTAIYTRGLYLSRVQLQDNAGANPKFAKREQAVMAALAQGEVLSDNPQETPRRYFATRGTHEELESALDGLRRNTALSVLTTAAGICGAHVLEASCIAMPQHRGSAYAPWFNPARGDERASMLSLYQLASLICRTPALSEHTIAKYAVEKR